MRKSLVAAVAVLILVVVAVLAAVGYGTWQVKRQGLPVEFWADGTAKIGIDGGKVRFDAHGIPTIEAGDWGSVIFLQGFVTASERLWQMDSLRRKAGGRLSEWLGEAAFEHDVRVQSEGRIEVSRRAEATLPREERLVCDAYARGVNEFIKSQPGKWGAEYQLLRKEPQPWTCADSLLVVLEMNEALASLADHEAQEWAWRRHLSPAWQAFLFPQGHRWNTPLFGVSDGKGPALPPAEESLPMRPLDGEREARASFESSVAIGSNNWAWRGPTGAFLANDPHLSNGVPGIWYAQRLRINADEWAVGVAVPGIPGITIGRNPALAWAFTNTGEDVDDYLKEELNADERSYLAARDGSDDVWRPLVRKTYAIKVKGEPKPREIEALFTHRGPMAKRRWLGDEWYSRQWMPLRDGVLRLPTLAIVNSRDWVSFQRGIDGMLSPSQNVLFMDNQSNIGYRTSGLGVMRLVDGRIPQPALEGEWRGIETVERRRTLFIPATDGPTAQLATANERIWLGPYGEGWYEEDRKERLTRFLSSRDDFERKDMEALHRDTEGRFRKLLLDWIAREARTARDVGAAWEKILMSWSEWDGTSRGNARVFTHSTQAEKILTGTLLARVRDAFVKAPDTEVPYHWDLPRAWLLEVLDAPDGKGFAAFGLRGTEVARFILREITRMDSGLVLHPESNRWKGQHPFVGRVPVLGRLFAIPEPLQWGAADLVAAEQPRAGPSMRMVWDMRKPLESTWSFPVGQSGHLGSVHYKDLQDKWFAGETLRVFDDASEWRFIGQ